MPGMPPMPLPTLRRRTMLPTACGLLLAGSIAASPDARAQDAAEDAEGKADEDRFLVVPYPITEPAIGSGVFAGPVWMRAGPAAGSGPSKPQAYGIGALWTSGGSRGVAAFDHRAWAGGRWRTTAVAGKADIRLQYAGLLPRDDQDLGFDLAVLGFSVQAQRSLGQGPDSLGVRVFAARSEVGFDLGLPPELAGEARKADIAGLGLSWTRDTRDDVFTPSRGQSLTLGLTVHAPALGASFAQQSLKLDWAGYRAGPGKATLGMRTIAEASAGDAPFYLRPYVALRGVAKMRYAGERAASAELELRHPAGKRWDVLGFAGAGRACSTRDGNRGCKSVTAGGVGVRFKAMKLFGLTFGVDVARGPDGTAGYIQIGNAWAR